MRPRFTQASTASSLSGSPVHPVSLRASDAPPPNRSTKPRIVSMARTMPTDRRELQEGRLPTTKWATNCRDYRSFHAMSDTDLVAATKEMDRRFIRLRLAMKQASMADFARFTGIGVDTIELWEKGSRPSISLTNALRLKITTRVTMDWLYFGDWGGLPTQTMLELQAIPEAEVDRARDEKRHKSAGASEKRNRRR
jgi:transcriptional regulator with XRE-family HTH domain